jgi:hypothetical protein
MLAPLSLVELLEPAVVLQCIIFVVEVEVDTRTVEHPSRHLTPSALPIIRASSMPCPTHAGLGAREKVRSAAIATAHTPCWSRRRVPCELRAERINTLHAEPRTTWYAIETDAVCMVGCVAAVAQQEDFFFVRTIADRARCRLFLGLWILLQPSLLVKLGNLFLVLDLVRRQ